MSEWALILLFLGSWANGVIIGWCLYDFKFYKRNLDKAKEASRLLNNAEKSYRRAQTVLRTLEGAKLVFKCEDIVNNLKD